MEDDILSRKVKRPKKQSLYPLRKKLIQPGEVAYDLNSRKRSKCAYSTKKREEDLTGGETSGSSQVPVRTIRNEETIASTSDSSRIASETCVPLLRNIPAADSTPDITVDEVPDEVTPFLNDEEMYQNLLISDKKCISISDGAGLFMVLPDLNYQNSALKKDSWVLIQRKAASFNGDQKWIYTCSCQPIWSREILSSANQYCTSFNDFMLQYPPCLHRTSGSKIYEQYDNINQITPMDFYIVDGGDPDHGYAQNEQKIEEAIRTDTVPVLRVWADNPMSYGLVSVVKQKLFCFCCRKNFCDHTRTVRNEFGSIDDNPNNAIIKEVYDLIDTGGQLSTPNKKIKCHSWKKLSFQPTEDLITTFKSGLANNIRRSGDDFVFIPSDVTCRHCGCHLDSGNPIEKEWIAAKDVDIVTNTFLGFCNVYFRPCTGCESVTLFDGSEHCFLNMGSYLVGHDVLRSYMHSFLHGRRPLHTFYAVFVDDHKDYGNDITKAFSYHKLRLAWLSFLDLLDIDYTKYFTCPDCGDDGPDVIICDGTSLAFQRRMWHWEPLTFSKESAEKNKKSSFSERIYLPDARVRHLLHRFAAGGENYRGKYTNLLSSTEKKELFHQLSIYPNLEEFLKIIDNGSLKLDKKFKRFVTSLSSPSPVCGYIHPTETVADLMKDLISGYKLKEDPAKWQQLHSHIPVLFEILEQSNFSATPFEMRPLLMELWEISIHPFVTAEKEHKQDVEGSVHVDELSFFPSLLSHRQRGVYSMDKKKPTNSCSKKYKGHPSLLPGVFTVYCQHGICFGFQVMQWNESPNVPFTIMKTRFKSAPKIVVYDNACALHAYCINRDAYFFKDTIFLVDRLHWDNHSGCSCGYCLDIYPLLKGLNSQINEQGNAGLKRIKDQLSYMTADNFMKHCAFYLYNKNLKQMIRMK